MTRVLLEDGPGLVGYVLVCCGIYRLFGPGWTLIVAGAPLVVAWVMRETRTKTTRQRKG